MRRREFIGLVGGGLAASPLVAWPVAAQAQQTAAGAEVCGRMSRSAPTMSRTAGWHATGTVGTMAAAAGCARLLKIPATAITDIMGITASLASGITANFGTMTKPLHAGHAARDGILAVQLGSHGFTACASALEGRDGFFENFARGL